MKKEEQISSGKSKTLKIAAQRVVFGQLLLMISQQHDINLHKVMCYPLGPLSWALATSYGSFLKTYKFSLMYKLKESNQQLQSPPTKLHTYY